MNPANHTTMPLIAATDHQKNIAAFARCSLSLAAVSGQVCFSFTESALYVLATNATKTSNGEVCFNSRFFRDYVFDKSVLSADGYNESSGNYSFVVSAKLIVMLFRGLDASAVNYIHLGVECGESVPDVRRYKLNVEVYTKKQVLKKYQIGYHPVDFIPTEIPGRFEDMLLSNDICHFSIEISVFKLFMDMVPSGADNLNIEAKLKKLTFLANTNQIAKGSNYLKQTMLSSVLMSVDDLVRTTLGEISVCINFRLKEFRNYINLIAAFKRDLRLSNEYSGEEPTVEVYFLEAGDPVLFRFKDSEVTVSLIQITASDGSTKKSESRPDPLILRPPVLQKPLTNETTRSPLVQPNVGTTSATGRGRDITEMEVEFDQAGEVPEGGMITYGQMGPPSGTKRPFEFDDDDDRHTDVSGAEEEFNIELGPTQVHGKPESLFD